MKAEKSVEQLTEEFNDVSDKIIDTLYDLENFALSGQISKEDAAGILERLDSKLSKILENTDMNKQKYIIGE